MGTFAPVMRSALGALIAVVAAVLLLSSCASSGSDQTLATPTTSATSVGDTATPADIAAAEASAEEFFQLLARQDIEGLDGFLAPAFQLVRADGSSADKASYLQNPAQVGAFDLEDFQVSRAGDLLIARYTVTVSEEIDRQLYTEDPRPRLSVFVKDGDSWQLLSHANLNTPNEQPAEVTGVSPAQLSDPAPQEQVQAAEQTQNAFFQAIVDGDTAALDQLLSPAFQLVRADGSGSDKQAYLSNPASIAGFELSDFAVTSQGDALVAKFLGTVSETIDGTAYSGAPAPRFAVMAKDGDQWRIVAQVNFNAPGN